MNTKYVDYNGRICTVIAHNEPRNTPDSMQVGKSYDLKDCKNGTVYYSIPRWQIVSATETQVRVFMDHRLS